MIKIAIKAIKMVSKLRILCFVRFKFSKSSGVVPQTSWDRLAYSAQTAAWFNRCDRLTCDTKYFQIFFQVLFSCLCCYCCGSFRLPFVYVSVSIPQKLSSSSSGMAFALKSNFSWLLQIVFSGNNLKSFTVTPK